MTEPTDLIDVSDLVVDPAAPGWVAQGLPRFAPAWSVPWLSPEEAVFVVEHAGEEKAYPLRILLRQPVVDDVVGGVPVAVTYGAVSGAAVALDRRVAGHVVELEASGEVFRGALVLTDRGSRSRWVQLTGQAVTGAMAGETLRTVTAYTTSWRQFRAGGDERAVLLLPDADVDFGRTPYPRYDDPAGQPRLFHGPVDPVLAPMMRVMGIRHGGHAVAVLTEWVQRLGVAEVRLGDESVVVLHVGGVASPMDGDAVGGGRDVGTTGAFRPPTGSGRTALVRQGGGFVDSTTATVWDVTGRAVSGPLAGARLERVPHVDVFWFAWRALVPETGVVGVAG